MNSLNPTNYLLLISSSKGIKMIYIWPVLYKYTIFSTFVNSWKFILFCNHDIMAAIQGAFIRISNMWIKTHCCSWRNAHLKSQVIFLTYCGNTLKPYSRKDGNHKLTYWYLEIETCTLILSGDFLFQVLGKYIWKNSLR